MESEMEIHPEEKYLNPSKGLSFHQKRSYLRKTSKIIDGRLYQSRQTCKVELNLFRLNQKIQVALLIVTVIMLNNYRSQRAPLDKSRGHHGSMIM